MRGILHRSSSIVDDAVRIKKNAHAFIVYFDIAYYSSVSSTRCICSLVFTNVVFVISWCVVCLVAENMSLIVRLLLFFFFILVILSIEIDRFSVVMCEYRIESIATFRLFQNAIGHIFFVSILSSLALLQSTFSFFYDHLRRPFVCVRTIYTI